MAALRSAAPTLVAFLAISLPGGAVTIVEVGARGVGGPPGVPGNPGGVGGPGTAGGNASAIAAEPADAGRGRRRVRRAPHPEHGRGDRGAAFRADLVLATPEPGTALLFGLGLVSLAGLAKRRRS